MFDAILYAIPFFVLLLFLEGLSYRFLPDDDELGYEVRDSLTSVSMGVGNVIVNVGWKAVVLVVYSWAYLLAPVHLTAGSPWTWVALFVADDFVYYWYHRFHHTIRVFWASHVVHHSSQRYNLSTALRQPWTPFTSLPFWLPLAFLGFAPWMILLQQSISLIYQFFIHTERVRTLPRPVEFVMNTPSHHRVHHGSNKQYLDKNFGGTLIIWDRMFSTFEPEEERVVFGLTHNINTFNPFKVAFNEFIAIGHDLKSARSWRDAWGFVFRGPGWQPGTR